MMSIRERLAQRRPVLTDGGMGQELYRRGFRGEHKELWSANALLMAPDAVKDIHVDFINAGAEIITTNTYCTNPGRLERAGLEDEFSKMNVIACELAKQSVQNAAHDVWIAGGLPPSFSYRADLTPPYDVILDEYRRMVDLMAPHVDVFLCETMTTAEEARAAATAALEYGLPVWVAWTLQDNETATLRNGRSFADALNEFADINVDALMVNCCGPEAVMPAISILKERTDKYIGAYANAFTPIPKKWKAGDIESVGIRRDLDPQAYAEFVKLWVAEGVAIVGGCCEIGPAHIAQIAKML